MHSTPLLLLTMTAGHSLGGALAQLAAYDIKMNCADSGADVKVSCYILGAPRVGLGTLRNAAMHLKASTFALISGCLALLGGSCASSWCTRAAQ